MGRTGYNEQGLNAQKKRERVSAALLFIAVPLTLFITFRFLGSAKFMVAGLLIVVYAMIPFFMIFERRKPKAREIVLELMNGRFSQVALKIQAFFSLLTACSYNLYRKYLMQFIIDLDDALQKFLSNNAIGNGRAFDMQVFQLSTLETAEDIVKELQQIMARLQEAYEQKRGARQDMISLSVKELLDQNYQDPGYSLADVAPAVGMSAAYLGRLFKKQMNQSVAEYLVSVRIGNARRLLEETDLPIREISEQVGFQDITYFYRIFKNANGIPPAQYRRNQRGIRDEEGE